MIVTLLTDFGTSDHFVASMKGVILSIDPRIVLVDISHEVPPQDVFAAAYLLARCHLDFPDGTVHLAVVDPGVGSPRRAIAARSRNRFYVGPDNGILSAALEAEEPAEFRRIDAALPGMRTGGSTFHGRDIFAPAAAALARGYRFQDLGPLVTDPERLHFPEPQPLPSGGTAAAVIHIDRFGNCVTNLRGTDLIASPGEPVRIRAGSSIIERLAPFYAAMDSGVPFAIRGSAGFVEICVRDGSAAELLRLSRGDAVVFEEGPRSVP